MQVLSKTSPYLVAAVLVAAGLACRKPAQAPAPAPVQAAPAPAPAPVASTARQADDSQARKMDEAAEAARKAEAAFQQAAASALQDIHFAYDQSEIMENDKPVLLAVANFMKQYPKANVFIAGNCDERGTVEYNLALGERRAHAAMAYLVGLGVPADRLSMTSYGKEKPLCTESAESCWVRNRRDHFSLK
jgi:peptidoglycan-associated lipoprotein